MAVYLVQHGKSLPKEVDPDRGLSEEGRQEVRRMAEVARQYGVNVAEIVHSGKKRALQTAEIFAAALNPPQGIRAVNGINPMDDAGAPGLAAGSQRMLVGHLPFMERLTAYLITGSVQPPVIRFQNGGIVSLGLHPDTGSWVIQWTLMPHIG